MCDAVASCADRAEIIFWPDFTFVLTEVVGIVLRKFSGGPFCYPKEFDACLHGDGAVGASLYDILFAGAGRLAHLIDRAGIMWESAIDKDFGDIANNYRFLINAPVFEAAGNS